MANSAISIENPPSPTKATHGRSGYAICAAIVYGRPEAMLASVPESECIWPRFTGIWRAHHVAMVPESHDTMALFGSRLPSSQATTCGFIGLSSRVPRSSISFHQSFMPACAFSRKPRCLLRLSSGSSSVRLRVAVADHADFDRVAQADARRVDVDLHAARLARLG